MMGDHCFEKDGATGIFLFFMIDIGQRAYSMQKMIEVHKRQKGR